HATQSSARFVAVASTPETARPTRRSLLPNPVSALLWSLCATSLWVWGCGPSIQPIHEGGVRFEHCYRLDLDPKIAPGHRHACWKQWLEVYSYGQSRDRIEYSQRRLRDLEAGDTNPTRLNLDQQQARETRQFYMATPAPTSVHAPPP